MKITEKSWLKKKVLQQKKKKKNGEFFESTKEDVYSKLDEETNSRKVTELFYTFLWMPDEVAKFD